MFGSIKEDVKSVFQSGNMISKIIVVNVVILIVLLLAKVFFQHIGYFDTIFNFFAMPGPMGKLLFKPWTIITYMFTHIGFWHILWNMVGLFWFGRIVGDLIGDQKILPIYLITGLGGALFFLLWANIPSALPNASVHGASACVMGLAVVAATIAPDYMIRLLLIGDVRLKYVVLVFIILDLIGVAGQVNQGGHVTHFGGLFFGWLYVVLLKSGTDLGRPFYFIENIGQKSSFSGHKKSPLRVEFKANRSTPDTSHPTFDKEIELNRILDKIKTHGYDKLTKAEKDFLQKASQG